MNNVPNNTSLYKYIGLNYSHELQAATRRYIRTAQKIATQKQQLTFNHRCKYHGVLPPSLRVRPLVKTNAGRRIAKRASFQFLSARISQNTRRFATYQPTSFFRSGNWSSRRQGHAEALQQLRETSTLQETEKTKARHKNKFDQLLQRQRIVSRTPSQSDTSRRVTDLSSRQLSHNFLATVTRELDQSFYVKSL